MNELLDLRIRSASLPGSKKRWNAYSALKSQFKESVPLYALSQGFLRDVKHPISIPVFLTFLHLRKNKRHDPDNFAFGAQKVICDALQPEYLANDGWNNIRDFAHRWMVHEGREGVLMALSDSRCFNTEDMVIFNEQRTRKGSRRAISDPQRETRAGEASDEDS